VDGILSHGAQRHTFADQGDAALVVVFLRVRNPSAVLFQFGKLTRGNIDLAIGIIATDVMGYRRLAQRINTAREEDDPSAPCKHRINRLLDGIGIIGHTIRLGAKLLGRDDMLRWHIWHSLRPRPHCPPSQQH